MTEEIIARLRSLDLSDGGSHSRLSAIASCFLEPAFGWTRGACEELKSKLIWILEGKDGNDDYDHFDGRDYGHHRCDQHRRQVSYDVLGNERHKAVCELRNTSLETGSAVKKLAHALGVKWNPDNVPKSMGLLRGRLIHLLGGDECNFSGVESYMDAMGEKSNPAETSDASTDHVSFDTRLKLKTYAYIILEFADTLGIDYPNGSKITDVAVEVRKRLSVLMSEHKAMDLPKSAEIAKPESEDGGEVTITDELREFATDPLLGYASQELHVERITAIADRIDEQFDRICEQQEKVLQQTIDEMTTELDSAKAKNKRLTQHIDQMQGGSRKWREKCEALKAERDELQAKLDDYDKTHIELPKDENDEYIHIGDVMDGYAKTIEVVELRYGRSGWVLISMDGNGYADTFAFEHHYAPTVEQVIRDLTLGKITESQAIDRIEGINGQG